MNIVNIIIDKFEKKILLIFKNNSRFDLKSKIKNYKNLDHMFNIINIIIVIIINIIINKFERKILLLLKERKS